MTGQSRRALAAIGACACVTAVVAAPLASAVIAGEAASQQLPAITTQVPVPSDAAGSPGAQLDAVSCAPVDACLSVGSYVNDSARTSPLLAASVNGAATRVSRGALPGAAGSGAAGELRAVSCASFEHCLAAGDYTTAAGRTVGYVETWTSGVQHPEVPPLPPGAAANPHELLLAASCAASGGCAVAGSYVGPASAVTPLVERLGSNGQWLSAVSAPVPSNAALAPHAVLDGVACWATGGCLAAGTYTDSTGATEPDALRLTGFVAGTATAIAVPAGAAANPHATVAGTACASATWCVVDGTYRTASGVTALFDDVVTASGSTAYEVTLPADAAASPLVVGGGISCAVAGACLLAGSYVSAAHGTVGLTAQLLGTPAAQAIVAPARAAGSSSRLMGVSCSVLGACTVAGTFTDTSQHAQAAIGAAFLAPGAARALSARQVAAGEVRVSWAAPSVTGAGVASYTVDDSVGAIAGPQVLVGATTATSLVVGGLRAGTHYRFSVTSHADDLGASSPATVALTTLQAASAPRNVRAVAGSRSVNVSWAAPATSFGSPITGYEIDVTWSGGSEQVGIGNRLSVTVPGLPAGRADRFSVAATTAAGTGTWSTTVICTPKA